MTDYYDGAFEHTGSRYTRLNVMQILLSAYAKLFLADTHYPNRNLTTRWIRDLSMHYLELT